MTAKLIPRVGDRVLVKERYTAIPDSPTYVGTVIRPANTEYTCLVQIDGRKGPNFVNETWLTVVDRSPVEWPEGWSRSILSGHAKLALGVDGSSVSLTKHEVECILATGPDMLRDWPELMGGAE